ncbi:MAG: lamin tail domain-containing protein [Ardenticatenaceae bacterium]
MTRQKGMRPYGFVFLSVFSFWVLYGTLLVYAQVAKEYVAADGPNGLVLISEFMASNDNTLADEDGDYSDWIEIHNRDSTLVNLEGWYLTDDDDELTKWRFPSATLAPDSYLVVFASNKDRADAGSVLHTNFKIKSSGEYLALVEPDGRTIAAEYAPEYPPQFEDVSYGLDALLNERYFSVPTPGEANAAGSGDSDLGPLISNATHRPSFPTASEAMTVTVTVQESLDPVDSVMLHYRVMYSETFTTPMFDDGMHGDGAASDSVYGATIPPSAAEPGEMVRYYITATDTEAHTSRWPLFHERTNSPEYLGTMIADEGITSALPILYWFVEDIAASETQTGTRAALFYNETFYDNVFVRLRGYSSRKWPKKSFKIDFNPGDHFQFSANFEPLEEFDLNSTYIDQSYMRETLAWETYRESGVPYSIAFPIRVQRNSAFYSVATLIEHPDQRYLERLGYDPNGALYKAIWNILTSTEGMEKKTRLDEDKSDLQALVDGLDLPSPARTIYLFDHVNIPATINYLAANSLMREPDAVSRNYYLYRDSEGTGEWMFLPWDRDQIFRSCNSGANPGSCFHPLYGSSEAPFFVSNYWNHFIDVLYQTPAIREMYLRRLRTLMDELLQPPSTPATQLYYDSRIDEFFTQMQPDVLLDAAIWQPSQPFTDAVNSLKTDYIAGQRVNLYNNYGPEGIALIPDAQPATPLVHFDVIEFNPLSGDPAEEYFTLVNAEPFAVDISGWRIGGQVKYTFQSGTVIPSGRTLIVSPHLVAFRNRATSPTGGEGHFVQGNYEGRLTNTRGQLALFNAQGKLIDSTDFGLDLSPLAGQVIVTELNYHPPDDGDEYEFIELKNISDNTLTLGAAQFRDGIDYTFPATTTLKAGQILVLIRQADHFSKRYPEVSYAGIYSGKLSNGGEFMSLLDKNGNIITWLQYDDEPLWPQTADGDGYTLVRHDLLGDPNDPCHWRASTNLYGSPGYDEPPSGLEVCKETYLPLVSSDAP